MHPKSTWLTNLFGMFKKNVCCLSKLTKRCGTQTGGVAKQQAQNKLTFFFVCEVSFVKTAYLRMHKGVDATKLSCFFFFEHTQQKETG